MTPSLFVKPPKVSHLPLMPFPICSIMTQAGDVMQQLPQSANGVSRLSRAASDAKRSSQSQQVRHKSPLDREHLITQSRNVTSEPKIYRVRWPNIQH